MKVLRFSLLLFASFVVQIAKGRLVPNVVYTARGTCPTVEVISEFDMDRYLGLWYEIARFPVIYELNAKCVTAEYSQSEERPKTIKVKNSSTNENGESNNVAEGRATTPDPDEPGKLRVSFTPQIIETAASRLLSFAGYKGFEESNYWILDTDYEKYALVHSCNQRRGFYTMANWILTRTPNPDKELVTRALDVFDGYGIPTEKFIFTEQLDCGRDYPEESTVGIPVEDFTEEAAEQFED